jgi:hypothetical protein
MLMIGSVVVRSVTTNAASSATISTIPYRRRMIMLLFLVVRIVFRRGRALIISEQKF